MTTNANTNLTALFDTLRTLAESNPAVLCKLRAIATSAEATSTANDAELFLQAFDKLDGGRFFVRICNVRKELGWSEDRFDEVVRTLRKDGTIQLCGGDPIDFTREELEMGFTDIYNNFYLTMKRVPRR